LCLLPPLGPRDVPSQPQAGEVCHPSSSRPQSLSLFPPAHYARRRGLHRTRPWRACLQHLQPCPTPRPPAQISLEEPGGIAGVIHVEHLVDEDREEGDMPGSRSLQPTIELLRQRRGVDLAPARAPELRASVAMARLPFQHQHSTPAAPSHTRTRHGPPPLTASRHPHSRMHPAHYPHPSPTKDLNARELLVERAAKREIFLILCLQTRSS
jgi:hypothetical protein